MVKVEFKRTSPNARDARRRRTGHASKALRVVCLLAAAGTLALLVVWSFPGGGPANVGGALTDKYVDGFVYRLEGQPVSGAEVRVEIWGGYWPEQDFLRTSQSTHTDSSGYYQVVIDANYWDPHNTIWVYATDGVLQGETKVEADAEAGQMVDLTLGQAIPEFDVPIAVFAVGIPVILKLRSDAPRTRRKP